MSVHAGMKTEIDNSRSRQKIALLVLGMHRSGTSALTRTLGLMGAALPKTLIAADQNNPAGYWEPRSINGIDNQLLETGGSGWEDWRGFSFSALTEDERAKFVALIARALNDEYEDRSPILIKDPRIARFVPFYEEILKDKGFSVRCVIPFRDPLAVAQSLHARDGMNPGYASLLWLRHVLDAEFFTRSLTRSFSSFDALLRDWKMLVQKLGRELDVTWPRSIDDAGPEVERFLNKDFWHHRDGLEDSSIQKDILRLLRLTVDGLHSFEADPSDPSACQLFDRIRQDLEGIGPVAISTMYDEMLSRQARHQKNVAELKRASKTLSQVQEKSSQDANELKSLQQEVVSLRSSAANFTKEIEKRDVQLIDLHSTVADLQKELAKREEIAELLQRRQQELEELNEKLQRTSSDHAHKLTEMAQDIEELTRRNVSNEAIILDYRRQLESQQTELAEAAAVKRSSEEEIKDLKEGLRKEKRRSSDLRKSVESSGEKLGEIQRYVDFLRKQVDVEVEAVTKQVQEREAQLAQLSADHSAAWQKVAEAHQYNVDLSEQLVTARARVAELERKPSWYPTAVRHNWNVWYSGRKLSLGTRLQLIPAHQIEAVSSDNRFSEWLMTGNDPNFQLVWESAEWLPAGHYAIAFDTPEGLASFKEPKLYVDTGSGYNEQEAVLLRPLGKNDRRFVAKFSIPNRFRSLRFDPSVKPGRLVLGEPRLRLLSRLEFYAHTARRVAEARRRLDGSLWPSLKRGLGAVRRGGIKGGAAALRSTAQRLASTDWGRTEGGQRRFIAHQPVYVPMTSEAPPVETPATLICFYLPQFHPIAQNDAWWGEGFTEWTNVRPAEPQFEGHYQPHVPDVLGYYDLRDSEVQRKQIELAKLYGIGGFCFYFYWFAGERLLETPIENYLADPTLDFPFCLCWANENWSRRWDGKDSEILIAQAHSPEDDLAFISYVSKYLRDPRYIRIGGKPLLLVYRPSLLPVAAETVQRWRQWSRENGIGEIYLAYTQSFEANDPHDYGFDAAVEFPPNNSAPPSIVDTVVPLKADFESKVYDWTIFPERSRNYTQPAYTLFRSVTPAWDNTARRKNRGTIFANSTPELYAEWLGNAIVDTCKRFERRDERLVFVNAWNEWAEGAHLEPDQRYGFAYLQATRKALEKAATRHSRRIVLVSHDAHPHGAQLLALNMAKGFGDLGFDVDLIVLGDGPLMGRFREVATVHSIDLENDPHAAVTALLAKIRETGAEVAVANTTVSGMIVPLLKRAGFQTISLIHELPGVLSSYKLQEHASEIAAHADKIVFPDALVREGFESFVGRQLDKAVIRPQGTYLQSPYRFTQDMRPVRNKIRSALGLSPNVRIVMCAGYGDYRKGLDIFVESLMRVMEKNDKVIGLWVGHCDEPFLAKQNERIRAAGLEKRFIFTGFVREPQDYYAASDIYALTSREDPFPSVVMEAFDAHVPVVGFEGAGGFETLLRRGCGLLVPAFETNLFADALTELLENPEKARRLADIGREIVVREYAFRHYLFDLLEFAGKPLRKVSVVVPNYNYERYIKLRLDSVVGQRYPIYELLVLDDCSTDGSMRAIRNYLGSCPIPAVLVANEKNSGSVFIQWSRGTEMAKGDLVWIAEADDLADPEFIEELVASFDDPDVVIAYAQSRMIDSDGNVTSEDYLGYVADIDSERWKAPYVVPGQEEIAKAMFVKNTIPNVSAVVFRRDALLQVLEDNFAEITSYRNAGDWVTYLRLLEMGAIAFTPRVLNSHRRHQSSVTISGYDLRQLREIIAVQRDTIERFKLDDSACAAAEAYSQKLYEQFGLMTPEHPHFKNHPHLQSEDAA